jgi:hypothetical protein
MLAGETFSVSSLSPEIASSFGFSITPEDRNSSLGSIRNLQCRLSIQLRCAGILTTSLKPRQAKRAVVLFHEKKKDFSLRSK